MRIAIHDSERETLKHKTFPNYALMKISAYHKSLGDTVEWFIPSEKYDKVYSSKVFDFTPENPYLPPDTIKGGTGYDVHSTLPAEIESCYPDYSIYPECDYAIGYITRGCPNHCRWCVVPEKEGDIKPYRTWRQLVRPDTDKLVLMDNNILACEYGINQLESLIDSGYKIDLNQGMDARLVTDRIARILSRLQWIRHIRFSCDSIPQIDAIIHAAELLQKYGVKPYKLFVYLLVTSDLENAAYRVEKLKQLKGINLYAQAERNVRKGIVPNKEQLEFAQRYVYSGKYRSETWQEYCQRKNKSRALTIKPITLKAANDFVKRYHRHNLPTVGCKFAIACYNNDNICGVAICGRPTARNADDGKTVEIYRNCTDGTYNACSKLYGACVKVAKDMGYDRVITYILDSENGASVLASNFVFDGRAGLPEQTGSRQKSRAVAPKEYKKRYVYNIVPPNDKEDKIMTWDGKALSNIVKECFYDIFAHEIDDNASIMSNKDYADLLKKKHNNSGHSCLDKNVYIHTRSNGIKICFKDGFDKSRLKELDGNNTLEISWSMAARHIRAWQMEKKLSASDKSEVDTKSKIQHEYDTSHLCGSPYDREHCSFLLYATEKNIEINGKPLEQYCVYCTENGKARKIGQMSTWTGLTPKFCSKRKAAENKKEESQMPSFDFSELSGKPDFNFAAFTSQDNQLKMIPLDMLDYNNDYERYDGERYSDMVESIKKNGILQPLIVRSQPDGRFYILAGNNRRYCGEAAGVQMFPCIVKENLTDEEAQAYIDETNVYQRGFSSLKITKQAEVIARRHSQMFDEEKLKAIRREIAMMNGEEFPEDQSGDKLSKLAQVGQEYGLGKDSIARLIRINELVPELKPCVDNGTIAVRTAVNLSYLFVSEQKKVAEMIIDGGYSVDMKKSAILKEISAQKQLNDKMIEAIVSGKYNPDAKPPKPKAFKIKSEIAAKYFAPDWDNDKVQEVIAAALEMYYNYDVSVEIGRRTNADNDEQEDV